MAAAVSKNEVNKLVTATRKHNTSVGELFLFIGFGDTGRRGFSSLRALAVPLPKTPFS